MTDRHDRDLHENVEPFARLWNGSEPGWTVHVHREHAATVWVPIPGGELSPSSFRALRALFSEHWAMSTSEFRERLMALGGIESNILDGIDAEDLHQQCGRAGFEAEKRDLSRTFYRLINERTNVSLSIDDDDLNTRVAEEAIRRGLPRRESTT